MSKTKFTKEQMEVLCRNKNVHKVTDKYIVFEADFKKLCLENTKKGITLWQTFTDCGFDIDVIGMDRIESAYRNWKKLDDDGRELKTGHYGGGRPRKPSNPRKDRLNSFRRRTISYAKYEGWNDVTSLKNPRQTKIRNDKGDEVKASLS